MQSPKELINSIVEGKDATDAIIDVIKLLGDTKQSKCIELVEKDPEAGALASMMFNDYTSVDLQEADSKELMKKYRVYLTKEQFDKAKKAALEDLREVQDTGNIAMGDTDWKGNDSEPLVENTFIVKKKLSIVGGWSGFTSRDAKQFGDKNEGKEVEASSAEEAKKKYANENNLNPFYLEVETTQESLSASDLINQVLENGNELDEGMWSRLKAKAAGVGGSIKGGASQLAGLAKGAKAGITGDVEGMKAAKAQRQAGASKGLDAKSKSIVNSHVKTLNKKIDDFVSDINKLKMNTPETNELLDLLIKLDSGMMKLSTKMLGGDSTTGLGSLVTATEAIDRVLQGSDIVSVVCGLNEEQYKKPKDLIPSIIEIKDELLDIQSNPLNREKEILAIQKKLDALTNSLESHPGNGPNYALGKINVEDLVIDPYTRNQVNRPGVDYGYTPIDLSDVSDVIDSLDYWITTWAEEEEYEEEEYTDEEYEELMKK